MIFPHLASYFFLSVLLVVFFLAFRLVLSFLAAGKATSSKRLPPFTNIPPGIDAPEMHVISEALEIAKYAVSIVEGALHRFRRFWKTKAQGFLLAVLKAGPIPGHIALIMDGNRRYALTKHMTLKEGYEEGATSLSRVLDICLRLDVKCITMYCFSIENFKRTKEEVDMLMKMLEIKFQELTQPGQLLDKHAIRLNIFGNKDLLYHSTRVQVEEAERRTQNNKGPILNLCMAYTSRDEITTAVETCVQAVIDADSDDTSVITEHDIDAQLMTSRGGCPPIDILLRSGGDKRLSDFLLWQCCENTQIHFKKRFWPEMGFWDLMPVMLDYQRKVWCKRLA